MISPDWSRAHRSRRARLRRGSAWDQADVVEPELPVAGYDTQVLGDRLGDDQSVEGVGVVGRQLLHTERKSLGVPTTYDLEYEASFAGFKPS